MTIKRTESLLVSTSGEPGTMTKIERFHTTQHSRRACKIVYEITAGLSEKNNAWRERGTSAPKPRSRRQR